MNQSLIHPLFEGPVDIVGDVHGEIGALRTLMGHLGYTSDGKHPEGRRLIFVGDLTDRGPDSLAVIELIRELVEAGRAQCVLGNHDLNILLELRKHDNSWFYGEEFYRGSQLVPQRLVRDEATRNAIRQFFASLPLALHRSDLRVVHACWQGQAVESLRTETNVVEAYQRHTDTIDRSPRMKELDDVDRGLEHQNQNPVKLLTSGPEARTPAPFEASGKIRHEERVPWWDSYEDKPLCIYGHYAAVPGKPHGGTRAICVDYAATKRHLERLEPGFREGHYRGMLAALRVSDDPQAAKIHFDDGSIIMPAIPG